MPARVVCRSSISSGNLGLPPAQCGTSMFLLDVSIDRIYRVVAVPTILRVVVSVNTGISSVPCESGGVRDQSRQLVNGPAASDVPEIGPAIGVILRLLAGHGSGDSSRCNMDAKCPFGHSEANILRVAAGQPIRFRYGPAIRRVVRATNAIQ